MAGLATGALWRVVEEGDRLHDQVAYGLPALEDGKWLTLITGAFFSPQLLVYVPIILLLVLAASTYERKVGHWRTLLVVIGGQALGVLFTAGFLRIFDRLGLDVGRRARPGDRPRHLRRRLRGRRRVTAVMQPVWRRRVRVGFTAFLIAMVLDSGLLWDVEHLIAWVLGLIGGPFLVGRRPERPKLEFGPRTQRAIVALVIAVDRRGRAGRRRLPRQRRAVPHRGQTPSTSRA